MGFMDAASSPPSKVGTYPKLLAELFTDQKSLGDYVADECKTRQVQHEKISQEVIKMEKEPPIEMEFSKELKFTVKPNLTASKLAYKNLVSGLAHDVSIVECCKDMEQYQGIKHRTVNPLQQFDYAMLLENWMMIPATTEETNQAKRRRTS